MSLSYFDPVFRFRSAASVSWEKEPSAFTGASVRRWLPSLLDTGLAHKSCFGRLGRAAVMLLLLCGSLCGCFGFGPSRLDEDQLGFSRALSESEKRQTLLNVVRLRYADMPTFLDTAQVISGYQLQRTVTGGFEVFLDAPMSSFLSGSGSAQLQQSPTFTFQPITGEHFAQSFLRPLSPADLLSLGEGGVPIDVLFRLAVRSVGALENVTVLERSGGEGSPEFFQLLHDLRRLQVAGLLGIKLERHQKTGSDGKPGPPEQVFVTFAVTRDPALMPVEAEARRLLGVPPRAPEAEVIYGRSAPGRGQIALLTRSMLGVLASLASQIEVPTRDVATGQTMPSIELTAAEHRPVVVIHSGRAPPNDPFTAIQFDKHWFWLDKDDFDSKIAFTIVNILLALAKTGSAPGTVITIPAH